MIHNLTRSEASRRHAALAALMASKTNLELLLDDSEIHHLAEQLNETEQHVGLLQDIRDKAEQQLAKAEEVATAKLAIANQNLTEAEQASVLLSKQARENATIEADSVAKAAQAMAAMSNAMEDAEPALKRLRAAQLAAGKAKIEARNSTVAMDAAVEHEFEMDALANQSNTNRQTAMAEAEKKMQEYRDEKAVLDHATIEEKQSESDEADSAARLNAAKAKLGKDQEILQQRKARMLADEDHTAELKSHMLQLKLSLLEAIKGDTAGSSAWTPESEAAMPWASVQRMMSKVHGKIEVMMENRTLQWQESSLRIKNVKTDLDATESKLRNEQVELKASQDLLANVSARASQAHLEAERDKFKANSIMKDAAGASAADSAAEAMVANGLSKINGAHAEAATMEGDVAASKDRIQQLRDDEAADSNERRTLEAKLATQQDALGIAKKDVAAAEAKAEVLYDSEESDDEVQRGHVISSLAKAQFAEHKAQRALQKTKERIASLDAEKISLVTDEKRERAKLRSAEDKMRSAEGSENEAEEAETEAKKEEQDARYKAAQLAASANVAKLHAKRASDVSLEEEEYKVAAEAETNKIKERADEDEALLSEVKNEFSTLQDATREANISISVLDARQKQLSQRDSTFQSTHRQFLEAQSAVKAEVKSVDGLTVETERQEEAVQQLTQQAATDETQVDQAKRQLSRAKAATETLFNAVQHQGEQVDEARAEYQADMKLQRQAAADATVAKENHSKLVEAGRVALKKEYKADHDTKGVREHIDEVKRHSAKTERQMERSKEQAEYARHAYQKAVQHTEDASQMISTITTKAREEKEELSHKLSIEDAEYKLSKIQEDEMRQRLKDRKETIAVAMQRVNETTAVVDEINNQIVDRMAKQEKKQESMEQAAQQQDLVSKYDEASEDRAQANKTLVQIKKALKSAEAGALARMHLAQAKVKEASAAAFAAAQWNTKAHVAKRRYDSVLSSHENAKELHVKATTNTDNAHNEAVFEGLLRKAEEEREAAEKHAAQMAADEKKGKKEAEAANQHELEMARAFMDGNAVQGAEGRAGDVATERVQDVTRLGSYE